MDPVMQIAEQVDLAFKGEAWHGPSLLEALDGVDAELASRRLIPQAHSIWEIVLHAMAWKIAIRRRLGGEAIELPPDQDWPSASDTTDEAWRATLNQLHDAHEALMRAVTTLSPERLDAIVPGKDYTAAFMMLGMPQHDAYHAGQIAILKKR